MSKYIQYLQWLGIALLMIVIPEITSAATTFGIDNINNIVQQLSFAPPADDLSVAYLAKIFGNVPGVPQLASSSTTILSPMFGVFNIGILALSGMFLSYTIFKVITETTMDGAAMGKTATLWTAVRVSLSTSLLIPQSSGYSLINGLVMWIVIQSVGLADRTWNSAIDYLRQGAPVIAQPVPVQVDYTLVNYLLGSEELQADNIGSSDVLSSLLCAYVIKDALTIYQKNHVKDNPKIKVTPISEYLLYKNSNPPNNPIAPSYSGGYYYFPYVEDEDITQKVNGGIEPFGKYGIPLTQSLRGVCGVIGYGFPKPSNYDDFTYYNYLFAKQQGLELMLSILTPLAKQLAQEINLANNKRKLDPLSYILYTDSNGIAQNFYYDENQPFTKLRSTTYLQNPNSIPSNLKWPQGTQELLNAAASYQLALANVRRVTAANEVATQDQEFTAAKQRGWIMAGSYYSLITDTEHTRTQNLSHYRLQAYNVDGEKLTPVFTNSGVRNSVTTQNNKTFIFPYFSLANTGKNLLYNALDFLTPSAESLDNLRENLAWIYFTYPYTKILGQLLYKASQTEQRTIAAALAESGNSAMQQAGDSLYKSKQMQCNETEIYARMVGGGILLAIPVVSASAIPILVPIPTEWLKCAVGSIMNKWQEVMVTNPTEVKKDPITKLRILGSYSIGKCFTYIEHIKGYFIDTTVSMITSNAVMLALSWMVAPGSYWDTLVGAQKGGQIMISANAAIQSLAHTILYMNLPLGIAVIGPLFVTSIILAMYVPVIPYMLFLFGALSWFISIIILMAAAPIICFLMIWGGASQDNPLLSREAEQFILQLVAVFFRPTLMVMGLVAGILLAHVGVDLLNMGFAKVFEVSNIEGNISDNVLLVKQLGFLLLYTFTMLSIVNLSFSTIYMLYSEALRIIGVQVSATGLEEKQMGEIKAGATQISEAGIAGVKATATELKDMSASFALIDKDASAKRAESKQKKKEEKEKRKKEQERAKKLKEGEDSEEEDEDEKKK